jgi:hypothetical protein
VVLIDHLYTEKHLDLDNWLLIKVQSLLRHGGLAAKIMINLLRIAISVYKELSLCFLVNGWIRYCNAKS